MKTLSTIIFVALTSFAYSQLSISVGSNTYFEDSKFRRSSDTIIRTNMPGTFSGLVQVDHRSDAFRTFGEIGYVGGKLEINRQTQLNQFSNPISPDITPTLLQSSTINQRVDVSMGYATLKAGLGAVYSNYGKKKFWISFSGNIYMQGDVLVDKNFSNYSTDGLSLDYTNLTADGQPTKIDIPNTAAKPFELVQLNKFMVQMGIELKQRFGFNNLFLEIAGGAAVRGNPRIGFLNTQNRITEYNSSNASFFVGLKIGYVFNKKNN